MGRIVLHCLVLYIGALVVVSWCLFSEIHVSKYNVMALPRNFATHRVSVFMNCYVLVMGCGWCIKLQWATFGNNQPVFDTKLKFSLLNYKPIWSIGTSRGGGQLKWQGGEERCTSTFAEASTNHVVFPPMTKSRLATFVGGGSVERGGSNESRISPSRQA